jgi:hypothetical protein
VYTPPNPKHASRRFIGVESCTVAQQGQRDQLGVKCLKIYAYDEETPAFTKKAGVARTVAAQAGSGEVGRGKAASTSNRCFFFTTSTTKHFLPTA